MNNPIIKRVYYAVTIQLDSPLCVSNGENEWTDTDVIRDAEGNAFIPGTSIAGAFRNYLGDQKKEKSVMGFSAGEKGEMSSIFISDLFFNEPPMTSVRDGVMLSEKKTVENKFDMEIIETGAQAVLYFDYTIRKNNMNQSAAFEKFVDFSLQGMQSGEIRFGSNKNRGFGKVHILDVYSKEFSADTMKEWLEFQKRPKDIQKYMKETDYDYSYDEWVKQREAIQKQFLKISIPLALDGGISIRKYSTQPGKADFEHLTCNGNPVIPGTSWNGAIRSGLVNVLKELGCKDYEKMMDTWFGECEPKEKAHQSNVVISESIIQNAERMKMTRNKINRFDASTQDGALYSEIAYFGGTTALEIMISEKCMELNALLGALLFVIQDIQEGFLAIGGQTAVGRGIFSVDDNKQIDFSRAIDEKVCREALYALIAG